MSLAFRNISYKECTDAWSTLNVRARTIPKLVDEHRNHIRQWWQPIASLFAKTVAQPPKMLLHRDLADWKRMV